MNAAALQSAEILVRFTNPAEEGRKPSIKASDGTYYGVAAADFGRFQPGGRYRIEFTERIFRGKTYRDIKSCEPIRPSSGANGDARAPSPARGVSAGEGATSDAREFQFVTRILAAQIAAAGVGRTREDLIERVKALRAVYREGFA